MSKVSVYRPKTLPDYVEVVQRLQQKTGHSLFFRGTAGNRHKLVPTLYRHPAVKPLNDLRKLESTLMTRFRQRSLPFHSRDLRDDWEALFFMQHYGVPTRLLDWTENSLIGLHFALIFSRTASTRSKNPAVVWVLEPFEWNQNALHHLSYQGGPLATGDEGLKGYAPSSTTMGEFPVAMYGAHNSPRIAAQQGTFTIFGTDKSPMEKLVEDGKFPPSALSSIIIDHARINSMRKSLLNQGITESMVFPDLEGLAREIRRQFGFEV
jgi:hypothetical protein